MIEEGALDGVDECYGYHNWPAFEYGSLHVKRGAVMAHPTSFKIVVTGKGGHGSQPHVAVDPVLTAAHIVVALQSVVARAVDPTKQAVCSVTMIHGGEVSNVIPDQVEMQGTLRDLDPSVCETMYRRVREIVAGVCAAFGASATVELEGAYPAVDNHAAQADAVADLARKLLRREEAVSEEGLPMMGAEDFSEFLHKVPGAFWFLGGNEEKLNGWARLGAAGSRSNCMCHNTAFDFNDNVSPMAAVFFVRLVEERLGCSLYSEAELPFPLLEADGAPVWEGSGANGGKKQPAGPIQLPAGKKAK
mmetsp:Transcript_24701/g.78335  ORF Transcript_24701/g.78335 Transcript_24701/m.78335 type:complete len:304 (+) Transcript_24701:595-1506(+)